MNAQQIKETIRKFKNADLTQVKDAEMRVKGEKLQAKQGGFTLLELLVVVSILAIIAGATISSLSGKEEISAQKTSVHTMAAMENSMRVFSVEERRVLPEGLDSLLCSSGVANDYTATTASVDLAGGATAQRLSANGTASNLARTNGGLTLDFFSKLEVVGVDADAVGELNENGLVNLRYVSNTICNGTANEVLFTSANTDATSDITEPELVEVVKPSLIFQDPVIEGDEWEFGAGAAVDLSSPGVAETIPMAFFSEPAELGFEEEDILAVFGVGPGTDLGAVIARSPQDGNAGPDKYSNYSLVVKLGECPAGTDIEDHATTCAPNLWEEVGEDMEVVAILDAGGDGYDDEIAEAKGNEEE